MINELEVTPPSVWLTNAEAAPSSEAIPPSLRLMIAEATPPSVKVASTEATPHSKARPLGLTFCGTSSLIDHAFLCRTVMRIGHTSFCSVCQAYWPRPCCETYKDRGHTLFCSPISHPPFLGLKSAKITPLSVTWMNTEATPPSVGLIWRLIWLMKSHLTNENSDNETWVKCVDSDRWTFTPLLCSGHLGHVLTHMYSVLYPICRYMDEERKQSVRKLQRNAGLLWAERWITEKWGTEV